MVKSAIFSKSDGYLKLLPVTSSCAASESRHAEARIAPEKETAGNSRKGSLFQEPAEYNKS